MKSPTCEFPLKPVVMHRNKQYVIQGESDPEVNLRHCACGTEWRHCTIVAECDWEPECDRLPKFATICEPERVLEDIDLLQQDKLMLIVDKGSFSLFKIPSTDKELLRAYEREYMRCEQTHIVGKRLNIITQMMAEHGYKADIHDVRQRLYH